MKGRFIVIEGTDGSGKATQAKVLARWLREQGRTVVEIDFPQYGQPAAYFEEQYLAGRYGSLDEVGPKRASLFYALDRYDASFALRQALSDGAIVIADRYVGSNMGHQGAKIADDTARQEYYRWIEHLEFEILGIPRPDLNVVLLMPAALALEFARARSEVAADLHEANLPHLIKAERTYRELCQLFPRAFAPIECTKSGNVLAITRIQAAIRERIAPLLD